MIEVCRILTGSRQLFGSIICKDESFFSKSACIGAKPILTVNTFCMYLDVIVHVWIPIGLARMFRMWASTALSQHLAEISFLRLCDWSIQHIQRRFGSLSRRGSAKSQCVANFRSPFSAAGFFSPIICNINVEYKHWLFLHGRPWFSQSGTGSSSSTTSLLR